MQPTVQTSLETYSQQNNFYLQADKLKRNCNYIVLFSSQFRFLRASVSHPRRCAFVFLSEFERCIDVCSHSTLSSNEIPTSATIKTMNFVLADDTVLSEFVLQLWRVYVRHVRWKVCPPPPAERGGIFTCWNKNGNGYRTQNFINKTTQCESNSQVN